MWSWPPAEMALFMKCKWNETGWRFRVTRLGVIPIGSGNDFAHGLNIPEDIPIAVERIFRGHISRSVDLAAVKMIVGLHRIVWQ